MPQKPGYLKQVINPFFWLTNLTFKRVETKRIIRKVLFAKCCQKLRLLFKMAVLLLPGSGLESHPCINNECPSQILGGEEEEEMPFMSQQSQNSVPPIPTPKPDPTAPHLMFEISSEDGFYCRAYSMEG